MANNSLIANLHSPKELLRRLADRVRQVRLSRNLRQEDLAKVSGVSLASLKRFESTGEISLRGLTLISVALNRAQDLERLFAIDEQKSLFEPEVKKRMRARR